MAVSARTPDTLESTGPVETNLRLDRSAVSSGLGKGVADELGLLREH